MKKIFLFIVLVFVTININAQSDFDIDENNVLTIYQGAGGDVVIPDGVTAIGSNAFVMRENITSVYIPASVIEIGNWAFTSCINLTTLTFAPNSNLQLIGISAFNNTGITSIEIPASVIKIDEYAFRNCKDLSNLTFAENSNLQIIEKGAFSFSGIISVEIPASVTEIREAVFYGCEKITTFTFAENSRLQIIGFDAFRETEFSSIEIPASVTKIEYYAFFECSNLTNLTFAENSNLQSIGHNAFNGTGITSVEIPTSITKIGSNAFLYCSNLINVSFAENSRLQVIDGSAFAASGITSIEIPASVTEIGTSAFAACFDLTSIIVRWTNPAALTYGNSIFGGANDVTLYVPTGTTALYRAIETWSGFNIVELPNFSEEDINTEPLENSVFIEWQTYEHAEGYRIIIYSDEERTNAVLILEFNAGGTLLNTIVPNRARTASAITLSHTINDLQSGTDYFYTLEILGINNAVLASLSGEFTTTSESVGCVETRHTLVQKIVGYYSILGKKLEKEPASGLYIILYSDGRAEKVLR